MKSANEYIFSEKSSSNDLSPTKTMLDRWIKIVQNYYSIDSMDIKSEMSNQFSNKRQFAPEYSNNTYVDMLEK